MRHFSYIWRYLTALLIVVVGSDVALAQNISFSAEASAEKMGLQDQVEVTYSVSEAQNLQTITPVGLNKDFQIIAGPMERRNISASIVNGKMVQSMNISLTYVIVPKRTGNFTIQPAVAKDGEGHTYQSNALNIQVVQGSLAPKRQQQQQAYDPFSDDPFVAMMQQRQRQLQALRQQQMGKQQQRQQQQGQPQAQQEEEKVDLSKDLFIRVAVDKSKVHVGEQITASYKLYARVAMNVSISKLPSLNGFWTQDFEMPKGNLKPAEEIIDGKKYQVFTLKKSALFPQQAGTLELDPAEASGIARIVIKQKRSNPFASLFDDPQFGSLMMSDPFFSDDIFSGYAYKDVKVNLKSSPVKINVTPLPDAGKPADYGGAVGNFTVSSKVDKTDITTDDAINYTFTITGSGNLKLIEAPAMKLPNGLDTYDPQIVDTITGRSTTITGSKIITYGITPQLPGDYEIPPMSFTYFNPQSGKYITLQTQPVKLHVKQGKNRQSTGIAKNTTPGDIHDIARTPLKELHFDSTPIIYTVGYWSMYALPAFAFMALAFWRRREDELSKDVVKLKNRRANKVALKRLSLAQTLLQEQNSKRFYEEVSKAVWLYLSDKLNIPLSTLSRESAREALVAKNVSLALQADAEHIIDECEMALYMPSGGSRQMANTYEQAVTIISKFEEAFNA